MKKLSLPLFAMSLIVPLSVGLPVQAAKPASGGSTTAVGNDISYPQCDATLPSDHAFGIVGVNGGTAANTNPCLDVQLTWAHAAVGGTTQPKAQLYVNTANPGEVIDQITTWPTNNTDKTGYTTENPYGICTGANDMACSWQYGWNRAVEDITDRFEPAAMKAGVNAVASSYVWWLDVETVNTWQSGSTAALERNRAALEGMTSHFQAKGAAVGIYSTNYQWDQIVGSTVTASSNLYSLNSWMAGARSLRGAKANCANPPLTAGGRVTISQYISGSLDYDYSCVG
jgi:hypothetical protein